MRHVEQTVMYPEWMTFVNMLHKTHQQKFFTKARCVQTNIKKDKFWDTCANFVHMVESILVALRAFDSMGRHGFS